jgi:hypothetical protein
MLNIPIEDVNTFDAAMKNLGYAIISKSFLVKTFGDIEVNITRRNNEVDSMVGYKLNTIIKVPSDIIEKVKIEINQCL